jgi:cellulose synthase/poly-beta-1,6-N-acetylglucosamine synthase-like glycosyltransferase
MSIILVISAVFSLYYLLAVVVLYRGLKKTGHAGVPGNCTYSVVIAARNEEENLGKCLAAVFDQSIGQKRYEVIVVNDRSTDGTGVIAGDWAQRYPSMTLVNVAATPVGVAPKKYAVLLGIERANHEIVVLTDADCRVPRDWLSTIDRYFSGDTGLVQGITAYAGVDALNAVFFGMQAIEFLSHGIVAAAAIGAGMPLNSNANNFAFRKKAFEEAGGYGAVSRKVVSGDDDLLLQRIAASGAWRVRFMADSAGAVTTAATPTVRGVFEQRKRWGSKTVNYTARQVAFLSGIFLFYCGATASLAISVFQPKYFALFAGMFAVKILGEYLLLIPGTALFNQKRLRPYILPASLFQLPMVIAAVVLGVFGKFSWKGERFGRKVR